MLEQLAPVLVWPLCYLIGSIPVGYLLVRQLKGLDIRQIGSGNIGTVNVSRVLGWRWAAVVLLLDALKGVAGVRLAAWACGSFSWQAWAVVAGALITVAGHNWSLFLGFQGGKGVATSLGALVGIHPPSAGLAFAVWVVLVLVTRYSSLGSIAGGLSAPVWMAVFHQPLPYVLFAVLGAAFIVLRHRPNLQRLLAGTEPKLGRRVPVDTAAQSHPSPPPYDQESS